jgi:hypothetical protein
MTYIGLEQTQRTSLKVGQAPATTIKLVYVRRFVEAVRASHE